MWPWLQAPIWCVGLDGLKGEADKRRDKRVAAGRVERDRLLQGADKRPRDDVGVERRPLPRLRALGEEAGEDGAMGGLAVDARLLDRRVYRLRHQRVSERRRREGAAQEGLDALGEAFARVSLAGCDLAHQRDFTVGRVAEYLCAQLPLAGEVAVERTGRHTGPAGDVDDARRGPPARGDLLVAGRQQTLSHLHVNSESQFTEEINQRRR